MLAVYVAAFALFVGTERAALTHAFVNADAEPCESFVDVVLGSGDEALGVGVLDAQYHVAAVTTCEQVVVEGSANSADVERSGG
jgi:hypothetical protein